MKVPHCFLLSDVYTQRLVVQHILVTRFLKFIMVHQASLIPQTKSILES